MEAELHHLTNNTGPESKECGENRSTPAVKSYEVAKKERAAGGAPRRGGAYPTMGVS